MNATSNASQYYIKRKRKYLKDFNRIVKSAHGVLEAHFDPDQIPALLAETRTEFENLILHLPYIGGKKPFTDFLVFTAMTLALYRTSTANGKTLEQFAVFLYQLEKAYLESTPRFLLRMFSPRNFSSRYKRKLQERAIDSQLKRYPDDYVFAFVEGDGINFDYGVDYLECGTCKFLENQGASELAPYICPVDILYSEILGWGLTRTQTIAEGADICDFRFKEGGSTKVRVPEAIKAVI